MHLRQTTVRALLPVTVLSVLTACGGGESGPPTGGPTPVPSSLAISTPTDFLRLRASEVLSAIATMSNGTTQTVTAVWSSDNTAVASVDASGRVTGSGSGEAVISAVYSGMTARRTMRVVPDYQGRWSGDHTVPNCVADGDWLRGGFCDEMQIGQPLYGLVLVLNQNRDAASGTLDMGGDPPGAVQGSIQLSGDLGLAGAFVATAEGVPLEVTVVEWQTRTVDNQRMTGRFRVTFRAAGLAGSATFEGELRVFNKTGSAIAAPDATARRSVFSSIRKILR